MKKSTKSTKPAAPQVKSVVPKPVAPKPAKQTKAPKSAAAKSGKPAKSVKTAPKPLPVYPVVAPRVTTITAKIDIGFGNTLFIRGEGPGLSWNQGVALDCVDDDKWSITLPGAVRAVIFKFLVNDLTWSAGSDYIAEPGATLVVVPTF